MFRTFKYIKYCSSLNNTAAVHNYNIISHIGYYTKVMRNKYNSHIYFFLYILYKFKYLCLYSNI